MSDFEPHIVMPTAAHSHTIILLHGRESTAAEFAEEFLESQDSNDRYLPDIFPGVKWVFPSANMLPYVRFQTQESQWFDMYTTADPHARYPEPENNHHDHQLYETASRITDIINQETALIGASKIFLGGISQGCAASIYTMLRNDICLAGFMGLCSWLPKHSRALSPARVQKTPIFLAHNQDDPVIDVKFGEELREGLTEMGMQVEWHAYEDGKHWVNEPKGVDNMVAFIQQHM